MSHVDIQYELIHNERMQKQRHTFVLIYFEGSLNKIYKYFQHWCQLSVSCGFLSILRGGGGGLLISFYRT